MRLTSLQLEHFKNYESLSFDFGAANPTILVGRNGQGKTNFLEAIVILALSKSFQPLKLPEMVSWYFHEEQSGLPEYFRIKGTVETNQGERELEVFCGKTRKYPKTLKVNGVKVKPKDYLGNLRIVLFTPQDMNLVMLSPQLRRRYVDLMISQVDREYLDHLSQYQVVLKHRNKLLGAIAEKQAMTSELEYWDQQLAQHGGYLLWKRREVFRNLNQELSAQYERISGEPAELEVRWKRVWSRELGVGSGDTPLCADFQNSFEEYLKLKVRRDIEAGSTCGGPHREDFQFLLKGRNLADAGSRGECRSSILALKLAEREYIQEVSGDSPLLLFDDVLSELDPDRQRNLLGLFGNDQVVITSTHLDEPVESGVWEVVEGSLKQEDSSAKI